MQRVGWQPTTPRLCGIQRDVTYSLRRLVDSAVLVQLSAPGGAAYTSTLWAVDAQAQRISLDADAAHPQIRALVDAGEATAVAYLARSNFWGEGVAFITDSEHHCTRLNQ